MDLMNQKQRASNRYESKNKLINIDIDRALYESETEAPATPKEELALELALTLHDRKGLPFYRHCVSEYPEAFLRSKLARVMKTPEPQIKKSRGALFNFLVRQPAAE